MKIVIVAFLAIWMTCPLIAEIGATRTWTSADGRSLEGELLEVNDDGIVLKVNGRRVPVAMNLLSEEDQSFAAEVAVSIAESAALEEEEKVRSKGFEEGPYADLVKGEWIEGDGGLGLKHQVFIGREVKRKKASPFVPLFIHLHGAGARSDSITLGRVEIASKTITKPDWYEEHPCVVLVPTCPPEPMTWGKDEIQTKLESVIDELIDSLPIDRKRIYLSGYSMGGQGIGKLIERRPDFYAAAVFADGGPKPAWVGKTKTAMWSFYSGERDSSKAPDLQEKFKKEDVEFRFNILPDVKHNSIHWKLANEPKVWEWLVEQRAS